jgi:1,4-dihydroxy-2-naphthoate octaprenyltransferase/chlorophyll synthase
MLLGQAIGFGATAELSLGGAAFGVLFTVLFVSYVVLLNDWGDRDVDRIKRKMFPQGCSPKTIPDGILPSGQLLVAGALAGTLALGLAVVAGFGLDRPLLIPGALTCLGIFIAYTLPPLRLNYRGGGELLEMLGVGVVLPWLNAYAQSGQLVPYGFALIIPGFAALALSSAVASGLSDERSDEKGGKRTFTTILGNAKARRLVELSMFLGVIGWGVAIFLGDVEVKVACLVATGTVWDYLKLVYKQSTSAVTNAFAAQGVYKKLLHAGIWRGGIYLSLTLIGMTILWSL